MMWDCIFCKIVEKAIPSKIVYEDDEILAFHDINPEAPVHVIVIPKDHIESMSKVEEEHKSLLGHILLKIKTIAEELGLTEDGYRIVNNCGKLGGQTVFHLHFHLMGGRALQWPPG